MPEPDVNSAVDWSLAQRRSAVGQSVLDLNENPDSAARAIQLGNVTGVPPIVVNSDLDGFEQQHKAGVVTDILNNNSALRDWVQQNPMASKIANDDWGQLDKITDKLKPYQIDIAAPFYAAVKGFARGTAGALARGEQGLTEEYEKLPPFLRTLLYPGRAKSDLLSAVLTGGAHGIFEGMTEAARQVGASEGAAQRFGKGMAELAEQQIMDLAGKGVVVHDADAFAYRFNQAWEKGKPWIEQGKLPPQGVDPLIDRALAEQAKDDTKSLDEVLDEAEKSLVRERSPDTFADLIRQNVKDRNVAIPFDAAQKLYGKKLPAADDGILGWAPDFVRKYNEAAATGGDIQIPLADWVAKVPPEVRRELKDDLRPDPNGMNLEETKKVEEVKESPEVVQRAEAVNIENSIRQGAGLNQVNALTPVLLEEGQSEAPLFGKMAIGLPKVLYDRWQRIINRQDAEAKAWELKKAADEIRRQKTKEWKEQSDAMRPDVAHDIASRPEWIAHNWFNSGLLAGVKGEKPQFDPGKLTPEQRKLIPEKYQAKGGSDPEDLARVAGFDTGTQMADVMSRFYQDKGDTPPGEFLRKQVEAEIARRMEEEHGKPKDAILAEAQDHVTGISQLERLHETTVALGLKAGLQVTLSKEGFAAAAKAELGRRIVGDQSRDFYLKESGKAGRDMIKAFLKQDWNEAFRQSQRQYVANLLAREVGKQAKTLEKFEKIAKKFSRTEDPEAFRGPVSGIYVPYIQQILSRVGRRVGRTEAQINDAIAQGGYGDLNQFAQAKQAELKDIEIPEFLLAGGKPVERLTGDEFNDLHRAITILDKVGRGEATVYKEGEAARLDEVRDSMVEKLKTLGDVKINIHKKPGTIRKAWKTLLPNSLTVESILNRWDRDDAMGVFNQYLVRPLSEAANYEPRLIRHYQEALRKAAGDIPGINNKVENSLWLDPYTKEPIEMSKRNVLGMLMYWGSPSSRKKLLEGYKVDEAQGLKWLLERTNKEDWDRAQNVGHIFDRLIKLADKMSMEINGVPIKKIDLAPINTPHGRYEGWYNPIEYERLFPGRTISEVSEMLSEAEKVKLGGRQGLEQAGYYRATTPQAYTKARTEYVAPVAMDMDIIPVRMRQMIHDIAFRPAVLQAAKFFYDPKWQSAVIHHYGKQYEDLFIPFLKDVANSSNETHGPVNALIEKFRQNLISTMVGFNPHTVAKHGMTAGFNSMTEVGPINFLRAMSKLLRTNDVTATTNWRFAIDRSEELQRRMRNWTDIMLHRPELTLQRMGWREALITLGSKPVAVSDLLSSVPTWLAQYEKSVRLGKDEGQAVFEADRAVRRAHGSSVITNLPGIMRGNAWLRTFTSLYGFFSHMLQKQFELSWKFKDTIGGIRAGDLSAAKQYAPQLVAGFVSYVIIPAVVEELVTPYVGSDKDSWGVRAAKSMATGLTSSWIGARDFVHGIINWADPSAGLIGTFMKNGTKLSRDLAKGEEAFSRRYMGKTLADTITTVGMLTGFGNAQMGRVAQFIQRWLTGLDRPETIWDWMHGLTTGTLERRRR